MPEKIIEKEAEAVGFVALFQKESGEMFSKMIHREVNRRERRALADELARQAQSLAQTEEDL